jgi:hypothetical protein
MVLRCTLYSILETQNFTVEVLEFCFWVVLEDTSLITSYSLFCPQKVGFF